MSNKALAFLHLTVFTLFIFILGGDAARWNNGPADTTGFLIHAFGAVVFCLALVQRIHMLRDT